MVVIPEAVTVAHARLDRADIDPAAVFALPTAGPRFFWSSMAGDFAVGAVGSVVAGTAEGTGRWDDLEAMVGRLTISAAVGRPADAFDGAPDVRWLGGFAFFDGVPDGPWSGFLSAWLYLPRACLTVRADAAWLSLLGPADEEATLLEQARAMADELLRQPKSAAPAPPRAAGPSRVPALSVAERDVLAGRVSQAVAAIRRGEARKVVVATQRTLPLDPALTPERVLARLRLAQPGCSHYLVSPRPGLALVGATPERLVAVRGASLSTMALAGSAPRDPEPDVDRRLGEALLASTKDREEHALVVAAIRGHLTGVVDGLVVQGMPRIRRLATIQHLETPITGTLPGQGHVLDLARRLHPTPALGGEPRQAALDIIRRLEGETRGWFGGGVGWVNAVGDGEFSVAIRCVLLHDGQATAFAGAGIVADSEPVREVAEVELKLGVALGAITDEWSAAGRRASGDMGRDETLV